MLKIRMQRTGRINQPSFRIVVVEHTASPKAGKFVDRVGTYEPHSKTRVLDEAKIQYWLGVGAKPSATVHNMLVSLGLINAKKINVLPAYKAPASPEATGGQEEATQSEPESPAEATAEMPAEPVPGISSEPTLAEAEEKAAV